jgi:hypothetical protein
MRLWGHPADTPFVTDLELSHTELRATIRLAGRRIVQLNFGRCNDPLLGIMRRVLREANAGSEDVGAAIAAVAQFSLGGCYLSEPLV